MEVRIITKLGSKENVPNKKRILDEESYVRVLEDIIGRDFFPDTDTLQKSLENLNKYEMATNTISNAEVNGNDDQVDERIREIRSKRISLDAFTSNYTSEDNASFEEIQKKDLESHRRRFHWAYEPLHGQTPGMLMLYYFGKTTLTATEREKIDKLLQNDSDVYLNSVDDHRLNVTESWPFRVRNPLMFPVELETSCDICDVPRTDNNPLIENKKASADEILAIRDGSDSDKAQSVNQIVSALPQNTTVVDRRVNNDLVGKMLPPEKKIVHRNTRMNSALVHNSTHPSPLEAPHTPSSYDGQSVNSLDLALNPRNPSVHPSYRPMTMTPSPMPTSRIGDISDSPLITWGEVAGTPLILSDDGALHPRPPKPSLHLNERERMKADSAAMIAGMVDMSPLADNFQITGPSARESVGHHLVAKIGGTSSSRRRDGRSSDIFHKRTSSVSRARHSTDHSTIFPSPSSSLFEIGASEGVGKRGGNTVGAKGREKRPVAPSPAAQLLAMRLKGNRRDDTPLLFGGKSH